MGILKATCRICKSVQPHSQVEDFKDLPPYVVCLQCLGCGVMGIQLLEDTKPANTKQAKNG
jgi:hypothetical protein